MADVSMELSAEGGISLLGEVVPKVGGEIHLEFDPAKANLHVDYSKPDSLTLGLTGEFNLKTAGDLKLSIDGDFGSNGTNIRGSATWEIQKHVEAKMEASYGQDGSAMKATVKIRF